MRAADRRALPRQVRREGLREAVHARHRRRPTSLQRCRPRRARRRCLMAARGLARAVGARCPRLRGRQRRSATSQRRSRHANGPRARAGRAHPARRDAQRHRQARASRRRCSRSRGPLDGVEREAVERHPQIGYRDPRLARRRSRWRPGSSTTTSAGTAAGIPERLAGERIPLGARILFVADAYEAMTSDQTWRPKLTVEEALAELERCAGTQFDPAVVAALVEELGGVRRAAEGRRRVASRSGRFPPETRLRLCRAKA